MLREIAVDTVIFICLFGIAATMILGTLWIVVTS